MFYKKWLHLLLAVAAMFNTYLAHLFKTISQYCPLYIEYLKMDKIIDILCTKNHDVKFLKNEFDLAILIVVNVFSLFCYGLSLKKGHAPSFIQNWIPFTQGCFMVILVVIGPVVLEKMKIWKVYRRQMDRGQTPCDQKAHLSIQLRWANKSKIPIVIQGQRSRSKYQLIHVNKLHWPFKLKLEKYWWF